MISRDLLWTKNVKNVTPVVQLVMNAAYITNYCAIAFKIPK